MPPPPLNGEVGASYIGGETNFATSGTMTSMGAATGDLLIVFDVNSGLVPAMSNANALTDFSGSSARIYWRVLIAGDLSATVGNAGGSGYSAVIFRGAASVAAADSDTSAGVASSKDAGGFTKHANHCGILCYIVSTTSSATCSVGSPPTFTQRASFDPTGAYGTEYICTRLQPASPRYVSGTSILWNSSGSSNILNVLELRT